VATGAVSLLALTPAAERCDGAGMAVALNVELDDVSPVLLYDDDDVLASPMHVATGPVVDRLTRGLVADTPRLTSLDSIDGPWQLSEDFDVLPPASVA